MARIAGPKPPALHHLQRPWDDEHRWERLVPTAGDSYGSLPTPLTPEPSDDLDDDEYEHERIDLRFGLQKLRYALQLTEEHEPIRIDAGGRFELIELLGEGAMGSVYLARDTLLDRNVALKVVRPQLAGYELVQERLLQEARALARISHPNVVQVHDVDEVALSGERLVALEYIKGISLRDWQARGQPCDRLLEIYVGVARGLAAAHHQDVIHRDFKPDNAIVQGDGERVVVVDFGLAGAVGSEHDNERLLSPALSTGLGTPGYMPPEQRTQPADALCDQYAFCVSLWEAIDGRLPFEHDRSIADEFPTAPVRMPAWLYRTLRRGLAWDPACRYPNMQALEQALERGRLRERAMRWLGAATLLVALITGLAFGLTPPPCASADAAIDKIWNAQSRADVEQAFAQFAEPWSDKASLHAIATLDAVAAAWSAQATQSCQDRLDGQPKAEVALRDACLEVWLDRIDQHVEMLRAGDLATAENLAAALDPLIAGQASCQLPSPPLEPGVRARLMQAEALEQTRQFERALTVAIDAVERSSRAIDCIAGSGYSFEAAAASFRLGHVLGKLGRWQQARNALRTAASHALACGDMWTAFDVRAYASFVDSQGRDANLEVAQTRLDDAKPLLARLAPNDSLRHAEYLRMTGLLAATGPTPDFERAVETLEQARATLETIEPTPLGQMVQVEHNIGSLLQKAGKTEQAEQAYLRAMKWLNEALGPEHPELLRVRAVIDINRGLAALAEFDLQEAEQPRRAEQLQRAEQLLTAAAEHGDPMVVVRAIPALLHAKLEAGIGEDREDALALALRWDNWLQSHGWLPHDHRADALTAIGQLLTEASIGPSGVVVRNNFERGVQCLRTALAEAEQARSSNAPVTRVLLALALFQDQRHDEVAVLLDVLARQPLDESLQNTVLWLREKNNDAIGERSPPSGNSDG